MVSLKDIAAAAGVSDRTVSRVVNNDKRVDPATREKISRLLEEMGYVPNRAARQIRTQRSGVIGLLTDVAATTPYSTDIVHGVQEAVNRSSYSLLTVNTGGEAERCRDAWRELAGHHVDGVIVATMFQRRLEPFEIVKDQLTVLVNCHPPEGSVIPAVLPEEAAGMADAIDAAVQMGYRRFCYIRPNRGIMAASIREKAFRKRLEHHRIAVREDWIADGMRGPVYGDVQIAEEVLPGIMQGAEAPDIIFAGNDQIALRCQSALVELGYSVPRDVALVGFDDLQVISRIMRPELSTVALPYLEMGAGAVQLLGRLVQKVAVPEISRYPCSFRQRGTSRTC